MVPPVDECEGFCDNALDACADECADGHFAGGADAHSSAGYDDVVAGGHEGAEGGVGLFEDVFGEVGGGFAGDEGVPWGELGEVC